MPTQSHVHDSGGSGDHGGDGAVAGQMIPQHPFDYPASPKTLDHLRFLFANAPRWYPSIGPALFLNARPYPVPPLILNSLGKGNRPCIEVGSLKRTDAPFQLFFAESDALDHYQNLARQVG